MKRILAPLIFPLILSLLLGGTGFWLNRATDIDIEPVRLDPNKPQYVMYTIRAQRFDPQGNPKDRLNATQAWQLPESRKIFFSQPNVRVWENGKPLYDLSAEAGIYDLDSKQADLTRQVTLHRYDDTGNMTATMNSEYLNIDTANNTASTVAENIFRNAATHGDTTQTLPKTRVKTVIYDVPNKP